MMGNCSNSWKTAGKTLGSAGKDCKNAGKCWKNAGKCCKTTSILPTLPLVKWLFFSGKMQVKHTFCNFGAVGGGVSP